jgi:hypothetical protein
MPFNSQVPWSAANAQLDRHTLCFPFWTLMEFDGTFTQFINANVRFANCAQLVLPGRLPATLISLLAIHRDPVAYYFLGVIEGTTTFVLLVNRPVPLHRREAE